MVKHQPFPIPSWVDPPHVCDSSRWVALHFRHCQNCFCLPLTSSIFTFTIFLIPGTFHPKRWSISSPRCPASNVFPLNSDPLNLALIGKAEVCIHPNALSSPLSTISNSKVLPNI